MSQFPSYPLGFIQSHDAFHRNQMCTRKTAYETVSEAEENGCKVYQCPYCHRFHRASLPQFQYRRLK